MPADYARSIGALERALKALRDFTITDPVDGRYVAIVFRCTKLIFDDPLIRDAVEAEKAERGSASEQYRRIVDAAVEHIDRYMKDLQDYFSKDVELGRSLQQSSPYESFWYERFQDALNELRAVVVLWDGNTRNAFEIVNQWNELEFKAGMGDAEFLALRHTVLPGIITFNQAMTKITAKQFQTHQITPRVDRVLSALGASIPVLELMRGFSDAEALAQIDRLRTLHEAMKKHLVGGSNFAWTPEGPIRRFLISGGPEGIGAEALAILDLARDRLAHNPTRRHVLSRLKTYLERFARRSILATLRAAANRGAGRSPEGTIQTEIDRFIFSEGLFPITHAVAGQGRIDTFFEQSVVPLFSDASESNQPALLLEVKQAVNAGTRSVTTMGKVKKAVANALSQAEEYRAHLTTNPRWADQEVYAVVVYDGPRRYTSTNPNVRLIYLGDAPPSAGSTPLPED